jgi:hypothetical protein
VLRARNIDADSAIRAVERLVQRRVRDRVLIPDLPRDLECDRGNRVDARRVVGDPAGPVRELIQFVPALLTRSSSPNRPTARSPWRCSACFSIRSRVATLACRCRRDHEEHLAVARAVLAR